LAIERPLEDGPLRLEIPEEEVKIDFPDIAPEITGDDDGGMLIDFLGGVPDDSGPEFSDNLAEFMEDESVERLSSELLSSYNADRNSRKDWEETYIKGLDQLGLKIENRTSPWDGACGVTHPILAEAVVRFQSQAIGEIFPQGGPVRTKVVGKATPDRVKQAHRVEGYLNYLVTDVMGEYRSETERMLFSLPLAGSAFKKVYWDPNMGRPCAMFVPSEDMVVAYGTPSLSMAERVTQVMKRTVNEVRKMQFSGFYRDIELADPSPDPDDIQKKYDELTGESPSYEFDNRYTLLEMHVDVDLEGFEDTFEGEETGIGLPYVITIELGSGKVLSIRRNWFEDDPKKLRRQHFVHYEYVPGIGFYGLGLIHMIGGLAKSATSILRQLVDAGTLSNLPGGLKARGLRIRGDDTPISPGEFRDVDVPSGAIRDSITFLPYKEPSSVLYQLLMGIVEEGRRFASLTDLKISDMSNQAPVGTTLALLERSMKVMAAIQARLHDSMRGEFKILEGIVKDHTPHEYPYAMDGEETMKSEDFDDRIDVLPVSDPNSATMSQRIMQYQAALQLAESAPNIYDIPQLHRQMLEVLGITDSDKIVPVDDDVKPKEPVEENMDLIRSQPIKAFMYQDHEAHIAVHQAASQDPKIQELLGTDPNAGSVQAAFSAHMAEHIAFAYRQQIEGHLGTTLPHPDEELSEDEEVKLSALVSSAAQMLLQNNQAEVQQQEAQEQAQDPIIQMRQQELQMRQQESSAKIEENRARLQLDMLKMAERSAGDIASMNIQKQMSDERLESQEKIAGAKVTADIASDLIAATAKGEDLSFEEAKLSAEMGVKLSELMLAAEKMATSERTESARIASKIMEKVLDMQKEMDLGDVSVSVGGDIGSLT
tara:strand:- start:3976 stop:6615 length:2640 start_codon:yes stop_codon:yes gene_type:complete